MEPGPADPLEKELAGHLGRGEVERAATLAIEGYGPAVLGYLGSMLDEDDAQDAFSLFAENLWRGLPSFRWECSVRAWAFRLAYFAVARVMRDPYRRHGQRLATTAASRLAASVVASTAVARDARAERFRKLREALEPEDRTLLVLRLDRELPWDEIAQVLSTDSAPLTAPALRKRFERLKARLAELARAEGLLE
jgi:RNA polymerase sigma-70 factor (ECF subfamily)